MSATGTAHDLARLSEIAAVLARHGLGDVAHRIGISRGLSRAVRLVGPRRQAGEPVRGTPERLRRALEDLGPTFVKLGQLLAGRSDVLPQAWTEELARLQEHARPVPWDELRAQLEEDLGAPPESVFRDVDPEPLAAASIAQIHAARLADGTPVVLKVRRPGIEAVAEADLHLLERIAALVERELPDLRRYRPRALVRAFARSLRDELDLASEARASERLAHAMRDERRLVIPRVHARWTCRRLLVEDRLEGRSAAAWLRDGRPEGVDAPALAALGAHLVLSMVFVHGVYHADPHPGNVIFLPDGRIGLVDFGRLGRISPAQRLELVRLLGAAVERHEDEAVDVLLGWAGESEVDVERLAEDVAGFLDRFNGVPLGELDVGAVLRTIAEIVRGNDLVLPTEVARLLEVFVKLEGLGRALDPAFDLAAHAGPFVARAATPRAGEVASVVLENLRELAGLASELPSDLRRAARRLRRGGLRAKVGIEHLDAFGRRIERSANRVTVGLVAAALIVGTAITSTADKGPHLLGLPAFSSFGFASSLVAGIWILISIARSR